MGNSCIDRPWIQRIHDSFKVHQSLVFTASYPMMICNILISLPFWCNRNPLYLGVMFVAFLLAKALWTQLDIPGEFRNGAVSVCQPSQIPLK